MQSQWQGYRLGGRYEIQELLGEGGMSSVYRAFDHNLRRVVAVKMIHSHLATNPEFVRRFEIEAQAVAKLQHANIMQVYDFAHEGEVYYMVLEYIAGESLQRVLHRLEEQGKRLSVLESLKLFIPLCNAVHYAHEQDMIHRDIKPGNIMLDSDARPVLTDFGLARLLSTSQYTRTGAVLGTALYMAPEQVRGEHVTRSADIYALGIILFELLTGHPPYQGKSLSDIMWMHVEEPIPDLLTLVPELPAELKGIVERALAKDPSERYLTAKALERDLIAVSDSILAGSASPTAASTSADSAESLFDTDATLIESSSEEGALLAEALVPHTAETDEKLSSIVQEAARAREPRGLYNIASLESGIHSLIFEVMSYTFHWSWLSIFAWIGWLVSLLVWIWAFPSWKQLSQAYRLVLAKPDRETGSSPPESHPTQTPRLDYPHDIELMAAPAALAALLLSTLVLAAGLVPLFSGQLLVFLLLVWVLAYLLIFFFNLRFLALNFLQPGVLKRFHFGHFLQTLTYGLIALPGIVLASALSGWMADLALMLSLTAFVVGGMLGALMVVFLFQRVLSVGLPTPALSPLTFSTAPLIATYAIFILLLFVYIQGQGVELPLVISRLVVFTAFGLLLAGGGLEVMLFIGYMRGHIPRTPLWWGLVDPFSGVAMLSLAAILNGMQGTFFQTLAALSAFIGVFAYLFVLWRLRRVLR